MEKIKSIITIVVGAFFSFFGMLAVPILLLVGSNIVDWITGVMATKNRKQQLSSYRSLEGIAKKVAMYLLVIVGSMLDVLIDYTINQLGLTIEFPMIIACVICVWLVCNEIISIIENLIDLKVPIPKFLLPIVKRIKNATEDIYPTEEGDEVDG